MSVIIACQVSIPEGVLEAAQQRYKQDQTYEYHTLSLGLTSIIVLVCQAVTLQAPTCNKHACNAEYC